MRKVNIYDVFDGAVKFGSEPPLLGDVPYASSSVYPHSYMWSGTDNRDMIESSFSGGVYPLKIVLSGNNFEDGATAGSVGVALPHSYSGVSAGTYTENNPIELPKHVTIVGDSLREVTVVPSNACSDLFHVAPGNYLSEMSFTGTMNSGSAICAFNPNKIYYSSS